MLNEVNVGNEVVDNAEINWQDPIDRAIALANAEKAARAEARRIALAGGMTEKPVADEDTGPTRKPKRTRKARREGKAVAQRTKPREKRRHGLGVH